MKVAVENLEKAAVEQQCRALRLPAVAEQCASMAGVAIKQRQTYLSYLEALLAPATPSLTSNCCCIAIRTSPGAYHAGEAQAGQVFTALRPTPRTGGKGMDADPPDLVQSPYFTEY